jgi:hypothetical protein
MTAGVWKEDLCVLFEISFKVGIVPDIGKNSVLEKTSAFKGFILGHSQASFTSRC